MITAGIINLDTTDEESEGGVERNVVQDIISIVAKDSPTDSVRRLVQMMRAVYACTRKDAEPTALYMHADSRVWHWTTSTTATP